MVVESARIVLEDLLKNIPVVRREQLYIYLRLAMEVSDSVAESIITYYARYGVILSSVNGLITNKENLMVISDEQIHVNYASADICIDKPIKLTQEAEDAIDAFWIILKEYPKSKKFFISTGPVYTAVYADSEKERIIEVVNIHWGEEIIMSELLKNNFCYTQESRKHYERIAILDNPNGFHAVYNVGFTEFYYIDKKDTLNHKLMQVKKRPFEEAWNDVGRF